MKQEERDVILSLIKEGREKNRFSTEIDAEKYLKCLNIKAEAVEGHVQYLLSTAYDEKNADDLELSLLVAYCFDVEGRYNELLCKLIVEDWHYKHEDIARILQMICSADSIDALCETIKIAGNLEYLAYDDGEALIRKCCWALGDIDTSDSIEKLKEFAKANDPHINKYALHQLEIRGLI